MFSVRPAGASVGYSGWHKPGQKIRLSIEDGDDVVIKIGEERVLVRDIRSTASGQYCGTVYGFEPSCVTEYKGVALGQQVAFEEKHVFTCFAR